MMTIFINRIWCVKVDPFVGNWSKRRQTETSTTKTSTNRNTDIPRNVDRPKLKRRQPKTSTYQNINRPKRRQTETSTYQNIDRPKRRQTKTNPKRRNTKTSTDQKRWHTKRRQTETWTVQFSTLYSRVFLFIILGMYYIYPYICMAGGMYFMYQYPQLYNYWGSLYISVPAKLNLFLVEPQELF